MIRTTAIGSPRHTYPPPRGRRARRPERLGRSGGSDRPRRPRRLPNGDVAHPAGSVLGAIMVALVLGLLLNADSLYVKADTQNDGWRRRLAINVMGPTRAISRLTLLDRPRTMFERKFRDKVPTRASGAPAITTTTTIAPPVVRLRVPTPTEPLRLWVGGDSMAQVFGQSVVAKAVERGDISATLDYRISTGLTRPDFFDWPTHLQDDVLPAGPEVIVIMFGANDAQSMKVNGETEQVRSPVWQAEYRKRVAATMEQLTGDGRLIVWVGQPVMREQGFSERETILDEIYRDEAGRRPWIRYLDSRAVLSRDGTYTAYLPGDDGAPVLVRQGDGIHLTRAGGDRLADAALRVVDTEIAATAGPGAPRTPSPAVVPPSTAVPAPASPATTVPTTARPPPPPTTTSKPDQPKKPWYA